jgi:hypothetical protein
MWMTRSSCFASVMVLAPACSSPNDRLTADSPAPGAEASATVASGGTASATSATTPTQEIYIDSVSAANPLTVKGRARTFENTVQVRARDARGGVIAEVFETSVGETGHHNPYAARVWLVRDPGPHVTVEAFEYSAEDGSVRSLTTKRVATPPGRTPLALMFATNECTRTSLFTRNVPRTVAVAHLLVEALVAGPSETE